MSSRCAVALWPCYSALRELVYVHIICRTDLQCMICRIKCRLCKSIALYHKFQHLCHFQVDLSGNFYIFCSCTLSFEVTLSANLLVGRHQSLLQNTNVLLCCSSKEWPELVLQSRWQIHAWKGTCTMASIVKLLGGPLCAFIVSMRWKTGEVWLFFLKSVRCEEMQCLAFCVNEEVWIMFYVYKAFLHSPTCPGRSYFQQKQSIDSCCL